MSFQVMYLVTKIPQVMTNEELIASLTKRLADAHKTIHLLAQNNHRLEISAGIKLIDKDMLNTLIRLAHPDKHNNSDASTRATKFLLKLRK